ncbi:hypothetical protein Csa_002960 [Cucumis sativus]|uniref:Uncharacterized protein n=1 Tax=Cucumis sativus TaxID=3659 RepID=A0A0A0KKU3_CUCSA|nr:hypothetical protein Csa_002960 [Cucumis sativus]
MGIIKYRNHNPRKQGSKAIPRDHRKATAKFNSVTDPAKNMANEMKLLKSQLPPHERQTRAARSDKQKPVAVVLLLQPLCARLLICKAH